MIYYISAKHNISRQHIFTSKKPAYRKDLKILHCIKHVSHDFLFGLRFFFAFAFNT